jgi:hypothetical protein
VARTRRNHAVEHATLQVLARRNMQRSLAGYSDAQGFWIVGDVSTDELADAVKEAINRLRAGERHLAIHPHCGTNFVAIGALTGALSWLALVNDRPGLGRRLEKLPLVMMLATLGAILGQPLGMALQANFSTDADIGGMQVAEITRKNRREAVLHRVITGA